MYLALNNLQRLICHKPHETTKQPITMEKQNFKKMFEKFETPMSSDANMVLNSTISMIQ